MDDNYIITLPVAIMDNNCILTLPLAILCVILLKTFFWDTLYILIMQNILNRPYTASQRARPAWSLPGRECPKPQIHRDLPQGGELASLCRIVSGYETFKSTLSD